MLDLVPDVSTRTFIHSFIDLYRQGIAPKLSFPIKEVRLLQTVRKILQQIVIFNGNLLKQKHTGLVDSENVSSAK